MADHIREIVLDTLMSLEKSGDYSNRLIRGVLDKYDYLEGRDKSFIKRVTEGVIERRPELDYYLDHVSSLPVRKMKPLIRSLLRMGAYQILYMDAVPDRAVCNEAVNLAGKRGFGSLKGFVNGVLRALSKGKGNLPLPDGEKEPVRFLSVKYSMPDWIVELWLAGYGREAAERILAGLMRIHPVSLRFSSVLPGEEREGWVKRLREAGVGIQENPYLPYVFFAERTDNIGMLPGYGEGAFMVQDASSALAVEAARIKDTDFVMDICAAPGGKSILAAEKASGVLSRDISPAKTDVLEENIRRMKASNIQVQVYDATSFDGEYEEKADVVFMDVPCSGLGVIGKKRDIKYRVTRQETEELAALQRRIVDNSWRYVKPGGILLYSTCTIHTGENEAMVKYISENLPFEPVSLEGTLPTALWEQKKRLEEELRQAGAWGDKSHQPQVPLQLTEAQQASCIQLLPGYMECDGFFFAKFRRREDS